MRKAPEQDEDAGDDDEESALDLAHDRKMERIRKRAKIRLVQVAVYVGMAVALPIIWNTFTMAYVFSVYCALRALAIFIKYRQESRPPRYSKAYTDADDLFPPEQKPTSHDVQ